MLRSMLALVDCCDGLQRLLFISFLHHFLSVYYRFVVFHQPLLSNVITCFWNTISTNRNVLYVMLYCYVCISLRSFHPPHPASHSVFLYILCPLHLRLNKSTSSRSMRAPCLSPTLSIPLPSLFHIHRASWSN